jgi:hypothetical protein
VENIAGMRFQAIPICSCAVWQRQGRKLVVPREQKHVLQMIFDSAVIFRRT